MQLPIIGVWTQEWKPHDFNDEAMTKIWRETNWEEKGKISFPQEMFPGLFSVTRRRQRTKTKEKIRSRNGEQK